jgi:hypothetical protein
VAGILLPAIEPLQSGRNAVSPQHAAMLAQSMPHAAQAKAAADALRLAVALEVFGHVTATLLVDGTDGLVFSRGDTVAAAMIAFFAADQFLFASQMPPAALAAELDALARPVQQQATH